MDDLELGDVLDGTTVAEMLDRVGSGLDISEVQLRLDHRNLETVYISRLDDTLVAHDRGETFYYLAVTAPASGDRAFAPWSEPDARQAVEAVGARLVDDESRPEFQRLRITLVIPLDGDVRRAVDATATAIDGVFKAHTRPLPG